MRESHLSIRLNEAQKQALQNLAEAQDTSVGALVRRAIGHMLAASSPTALSRPPRARSGKRLHREREMAWLQQHLHEYAHLRGHWLVIEGNHLVAHDVNQARAVAQARQKSVKVPFLEWIPDTEAPDFWMGL